MIFIINTSYKLYFYFIQEEKDFLHGPHYDASNILSIYRWMLNHIRVKTSQFTNVHMKYDYYK